MARSLVLASTAAAIAILAYGASALATDCYVDSTATSSGDGKSATTPVQTQAAIPSGCTTVHYARGSVFNEAMKATSGATTYTNYGDSCKPLPDFKLPTGTATSVFQTFNTVTIDGIKFESSHNTSNSNSSFDSGAGICVYLQGANSVIKNSEVTDCDFGIMLQGDGSLATQNYVHDVNGQALDGSTSSDPNSVGGGKGIYVMANGCEVSYNTIINTITFPQWTGANGSSKGGCDGGATEIAVMSGKTMTGYKNHHNFAYYTCGFFQASTTTGSTGTFSNSEFYYNVMIDTAWMILAQVNNTNFVSMKWENNTVVQHKGAGATADQGMLMEMWNGYSSGTTGGSTPANQIFLTNNLMVLEGVYDSYDFSASYTSANSMANNSAIVLATNIFLPNTSVNPGFVKLGDGDPNFTNTTDSTTMPAAADYDLTSDTTAISNALSGGPTTTSGGTPIAGLTTDFLGRAVPSASSGKTDIGAFQFGSTAAAGAIAAPSPVNFGTSSCGSTGGSSSTGGAISTGGSSVKSTGSVAATGGASVNAAQGGSATTTTTNVVSAASTGGAAANTNSSSSVTNTAAVDTGSCSCRVAGRQSKSSAAGWLGLLMFGLVMRRNRHAAVR